ncbi:Alpha/Beta hydrolase protein [Aspergillus multicolor]|uniref:Alpha/Beta hydrolase protein n=1 Tax=Aspergillus multicolor TaxID=41759 RepID=UPI003CCCCD31
MLFATSHPLLGTVTGRQNDGVAQFLGLKTRPISPTNGFDLESSLIGKKLDVQYTPDPSDTDGLNLNISVPVVHAADTRDNLLPVLVFIHGGGFAIGSNWHPQYNQEASVRLSVRIGHPVAAVNLGYRIGVPGFLTSASMRKAGYPANRGLVDQKNGLRWIRKYISGFGGDPGAITVVGQSIGAASIMYHLQSEEALFNQCILLGGTNAAIRPAPLKLAEIAYNDALEHFGLDELGEDQQLDALKNMSIEELQSRSSPAIRAGAVIDGAVIPHAVTFDSLETQSGSLFPGKRWCSRLFTLDSNCDSSIAAVLALFPKTKDVCTRFRNVIHTTLDGTDGSLSTELLAHYNITETTSDTDALSLILNFLNDIQFHAPSLLVASHWPCSTVGHFNEGNPWPGPFTGKTSHLLDVAYLWQNYNSHLSSQQRAVAEAFASDVIRFTAGVDDLPSWGSNQEAVAYRQGDARMLVWLG